MADDARSTETGSGETPPPAPSGERPHETSAFDVIGEYLRPGRENVMLVYILYLVGLVPAFGGVPVLVGFVMAILNRGEVGADLEGHYEFQIRQAIVGFVAVLISALLAFVVIGFVGLLLVAIWWLIRSVKGLTAASRHEPLPDPKTYSW